MKRSIFKRAWVRFWMLFAGSGVLGRFAMQMASYGAPPYYAGIGLAHLAGRKSVGFISHTATVYHSDFELGAFSYIGDDAMVFQDKEGAHVHIGEHTYIFDQTYMQTGDGGCLEIGSGTHVQPRCQFSAYKSSIYIGDHVEIAPNCAFYPYDHSIDRGARIQSQPLTTKGNIVVEDDVWLGVGVTVLSGARIGEGAVVGAGSVVTESIPPYAVAVGAPARVVGERGRGEHAA